MTTLTQATTSVGDTVRQESPTPPAAALAPSSTNNNTDTGNGGDDRPIPTSVGDSPASQTDDAISNESNKRKADSNPSVSLSKKQKKMAEPTATNSLKYVLTLQMKCPMLIASAETSACANGTIRNLEGRDSKPTSTPTSNRCQTQTSRYTCTFNSTVYYMLTNSPLATHGRIASHTNCSGKFSYSLHHVYSQPSSAVFTTLLPFSPLTNHLHSSF